MYIYMCIFRCCNVLYIGKILPREFFSPTSLSIYTRVTVPVLSNIIYLIYDYCMCVVSCICLTVSNCHLFMPECLDKKNFEPSYFVLYILEIKYELCT